MKNLLSVGLLLAGLSLSTTSCSDNASNSSQTAADGHDHGTEASATHAGEHIYTCPMHPEVVSNEPGKCPKCGMTLEHTDGANNDGKTYRMVFTSAPAQLAAGKPVTLSFLPQIEGQEKAPVPLAILHEKKMHLIIVSKDLSEFYHEHPEFTADGKYNVPFTFKTGGDYVLYQDYQPEGGAHQLGRQEVAVAGPKKEQVKFTNDQMRWQKNGYEAVLSFDKAVQVGQPLALQVNVSRNGQPVTNLDNYLGALGHMVIISEDTKQYLHVHPGDAGANRGPSIGFQTGFEQAGIYRVFLQFNHGGQIHTADFTVNVAPAAGATAAATYECPMKCEGSASTQPGKCPVCNMDLVKKS
ncbi:heavy metal-binding domain-containing protein [Hymenobacter radiodurans]|uniref:heavy metal-binding domain-containing protein n=1 Tax=Hymenobacter radiodurans TaxID=2496028 RepID=UPI001058DD7F|nr:heavy metal-binding domain-containing protein [Hymenobacter radiodurans]